MRNKTKIKRRTENIENSGQNVTLPEFSNRQFGKTSNAIAQIVHKLGLIGIISLAVILMAIIGIAIAQPYSLEDELALLEQELEDEGYEWLFNYSGEDLYPKVEVYEKDKNEVIAKFNNILEDKKYKILRNGGKDE